MNYQVEKLKVGGIITNYTCTVQCAHCRHKASPCRKAGFISEELLARILQNLETLGCNSVHIEGGEPFLYPDELIRSVKQINKSAIALEHIVTNCSWYKNQNDTFQLLKELKFNGLRRLLIKVGPFQNESIPLKKVINVVQVAEKLGINSVIWDNESYPEVAAFDVTKTHSLKKYIKKYGEAYVKTLANRFNIPMAGRSFQAYEKSVTKTSLEKILSDNKTCFNDFSTQNHFHVDLYGNFSFSHTQGVTIDFEDLGKPLDKKKYPFLSMLINGGIRSIYRFATQHHGFKAKPEYISKCHLCYDVRRYLVNDLEITSPDLQPVEFYSSE